MRLMHGWHVSTLQGHVLSQHATRYYRCSLWCLDWASWLLLYVTVFGWLISDRFISNDLVKLWFYPWHTILNLVILLSSICIFHLVSLILLFFHPLLLFLLHKILFSSGPWIFVLFFFKVSWKKWSITDDSFS